MLKDGKIAVGVMIGCLIGIIVPPFTQVFNSSEFKNLILENFGIAIGAASAFGAARWAFTTQQKATNEANLIAASIKLDLISTSLNLWQKELQSKLQDVENSDQTVLRFEAFGSLRVPDLPYFEQSEIVSLVQLDRSFRNDLLRLSELNSRIRSFSLQGSQDVADCRQRVKNVLTFNENGTAINSDDASLIDALASPTLKKLDSLNILAVAAYEEYQKFWDRFGSRYYVVYNKPLPNRYFAEDDK